MKEKEKEKENDKELPPYGRVIRTLRGLLGWSQKDLAARIGVNNTTIHRAETINHLRSSTKNRIAMGLGVTNEEIEALEGKAEGEIMEFFREKQKESKPEPPPATAPEHKNLGRAIPIINPDKAYLMQTKVPASGLAGRVNFPLVDDPEAFSAYNEWPEMYEGTTKYEKGEMIVFSPAEPFVEGDDAMVTMKDGKRYFCRPRSSKEDGYWLFNCANTTPMHVKKSDVKSITKAILALRSVRSS